MGYVRMTSAVVSGMKGTAVKRDALIGVVGNNNSNDNNIILLLNDAGVNTGRRGQRIASGQVQRISPVTVPNDEYMRPIRHAVPVVNSSAASRTRGSLCRRNRCATCAMVTRLSMTKCRRARTPSLIAVAGDADAAFSSSSFTHFTCSFIWPTANCISSSGPLGPVTPSPLTLR